MELGVGGRLTVPYGTEEIPPSFLGQGRKSRGESPDGRRRNATACGEDDSLRMTLLQDLVKRPPPWSKSKYRLGCPGPPGGGTLRRMPPETEGGLLPTPSSLFNTTL